MLNNRLGMSETSGHDKLHCSTVRPRYPVHLCCKYVVRKSKITLSTHVTALGFYYNILKVCAIVLSAYK